VREQLTSAYWTSILCWLRTNLIHLDIFLSRNFDESRKDIQVRSICQEEFLESSWILCKPQPDRVGLAFCSSFSASYERFQSLYEKSKNVTKCFGLPLGIQVIEHYQYLQHESLQLNYTCCPREDQISCICCWCPCWGKWNIILLLKSNVYSL
jgi:hypothetical protein